MGNVVQLHRPAPDRTATPAGQLEGVDIPLAHFDKLTRFFLDPSIPYENRRSFINSVRTRWGLPAVGASLSSS